MSSYVRKGANLRKNRHSSSGAFYSITTCCVDRQPVFCNAIAAQTVVDCIAECDRHGHAETFVFVVMPDHLHWLFRLTGTTCLSDVVRKLKGSTARRINRCLKRETAIWQRAYFERQVISERAFLALGDYVLQNPVRAGLVERWQDYPFVDLQWQRFGYLLRSANVRGYRG